MKSSLEIAQEAHLRPIIEIADQCGILPEEIEPYGHFKAKICLTILDRLKDQPNGKMVLVTGITPTRLGEGKTLHTIGMAQTLALLGVKSCCVIRQPSMGPVFGIKGGATGGGYSQVLPMVDINLGLTGDIDKVTAAHNLLAAIIDNHILKGNELDIDPDQIFWKRVIDVNDRSLREIKIGLGGPQNGIPRDSGFEITAASEIMAILALASDIKDLRQRLGRIVVAQSNGEKRLISVDDLKVAGALTLILKDAIKPNLVQTYEGGPCFIHTGPFGNIAHGCSSLVADRIALKLFNVVLTEAGFGSDLGGEKFFNIKCRASGINPSAIILVCSVRALKRQGGVDELEASSPKAVESLRRGCSNLTHHIQNMSFFGRPVIVAVNQFEKDTPEELGIVEEEALKAGAFGASITRLFSEGGKGGIELAKLLMEAIKEDPEPISFTYDIVDSIEYKIRKIAHQAYNATDVNYSPQAQEDITRWTKFGYDTLPVCIAKTQLSISDDPNIIGLPSDNALSIDSIRLSAGAGFLYPIAGKVLTMPGLPATPNAKNMEYLPDGRIVGLY
ncbi:MAG: formate--tetrahydrofolate ligase [Candidatus Heimdallarchaeota archaeon]|nr:MAG: formate--tetrahydrofolate ligase [Candidatus Heimdallarchaeota archaeon]